MVSVHQVFVKIVVVSAVDQVLLKLQLIHNNLVIVSVHIMIVMVYVEEILLMMNVVYVAVEVLTGKMMMLVIVKVIPLMSVVFAEVLVSHQVGLIAILNNQKLLLMMFKMKNLFVKKL